MMWPATTRRKPHARVQWCAASWLCRIWPGRVLRPAGRIRCNAAASSRRAPAGRVCDDDRADVAAVRQGGRACDEAVSAGRAVLQPVFLTTYQLALQGFSSQQRSHGEAGQSKPMTESLNDMVDSWFLKAHVRMPTVYRGKVGSSGCWLT